MPVLTPRRASTLTVNAVPRGAVLSETIIPTCSSSRRSPRTGTQISPRPYLAMKFTASGVTLSAAMTRSPSFSRSSSSTTTRIRPARISSTPSSIVTKSRLLSSLTWVPSPGTTSSGDSMSPRSSHPLASNRESPLDVLADHIHFQVYSLSGFPSPEGGLAERVRNQHDLEGGAVEGCHGQAHAVHGDRALRDEERGERVVLAAHSEPRRVPFPGQPRDQTHPIHVTLHKVSSHETTEAQGAFEVHTVPLCEVGQRGPGQRFRPEVEPDPIRRALDDGQADAVHGNAGPLGRVVEHQVRADDEPRPPALHDPPHLFDQSCEHAGRCGFAFVSRSPRIRRPVERRCLQIG